MISERFCCNRGSLTLVAVGLCLLIGTANAQTSFVSADKSLSFTVAKDWKAETSGSKVRLVTPDGAVSFLQQDTISPVPSGDLVKSQDVQDICKKLADSVLFDAQYVSAKAMPVEAGMGAVYRFTEKDKTADAAGQVDVWIAVIGKHTLVLLPQKASKGEPTTDYASLFKTVTFADTLKSTASTSEESKPRTADPSAGKTDAKPLKTDPSGGSLAKGTRSAGTGHPVALLESYEGHLMSSDTTFKISLMRDRTATAKWETRDGVSRLSGTYTGEAGSYTVELTQDSGTNPLGSKALRLNMVPRADIEVGTYRGEGGISRNIVGLHLLEVGSVTNDHNKGKTSMLTNGSEQGSSSGRGNNGYFAPGSNGRSNVPGNGRGRRR